MDLWKSTEYDCHSQLQQNLAEHFLIILQRHLLFKNANPLVLDVGCGNGRITTAILNYFPDAYIHGVDCSPSMISFAKQYFESQRVKFEIDRAEELGTVSNSSMDAVTSFSCLHWVSDHVAAFNNIYRVLKPGGWIGLMFAAETGREDPIDHAYAQAISEWPWEPFFRKQVHELEWNIAKIESIQTQLTTIGFSLAFLENRDVAYDFKTLSAFQ